jgi:hypothetical protein
VLTASRRLKDSFLFKTGSDTDKSEVKKGVRNMFPLIQLEKKPVGKAEVQNRSVPAKARQRVEAAAVQTRERDQHLQVIEGRDGASVRVFSNSKTLMTRCR